MTMRPVARALAACALLVPCVTGCFGKTHAEDPLPGALQETAVIADSESRRYVLATAYLPVPTWEAWDWFASADRLEAWLAREVTLDAIAGGPVKLVSDDGVRNGTVTEVDEPRSMTWTFDDATNANGEATQRALKFSVTGEIGGSRLEIDDGPFEASEAGEKLAVAHRKRWTESLRVLRAAVERRLPTVPQELPLDATEATTPATPVMPEPIATPAKP